jgi:tetratricopeptide (TPR) repeat protein
VLGDEHDSVAFARMAYGSLLRSTGEHERARELLAQAADVFDALPGHPHAGLAHAELGGTLLALGRASDAIPWLERALDAAESGQFGALQRATTRFTLAKALWDSDRARARSEALAAMHDLANAELPAAREVERRELLVEIDAWQRAH